MKKILFILAFLISTVAISQTVSTSMKATNLLIVNTDYTITNTTVRTFHVYAPRAYPTIQSLTVTYKSATGLTNVATKLYGKITELGDSTQISSTNNWNCTADPAEIVNVINTTANLYQYYTISIVGTGTGTAVIDKIELQLWNATYPNAVARLTGTGGMTITGETVNLNASSNYAINVGTGTSTGAVSIGGGSNTFAVNSTAFDVSTSGAVSGVTTLSMGGALSGVTTGAFSGVISANGGVTNPTETHHIWAVGGNVVSATSGTDKACSNGARWWTEIMIPRNVTLTGISYLVGSVGGTDSVVIQLFNSAGVQVATTRHGTSGKTANLVGTAAQFQSIAFSAPYAATAGVYYVAVQFNGTTAKFRTYSAAGLPYVAGTAAGTWGTKADITPGTTFTADAGPICITY